MTAHSTAGEVATNLLRYSLCRFVWSFLLSCPLKKNRKYLLVLSEALLVFVFMFVKHSCITKVIKKRASGKQIWDKNAKENR